MAVVCSKDTKPNRSAGKDGDGGRSIVGRREDAEGWRVYGGVVVTVAETCENGDGDDDCRSVVIQGEEGRTVGRVDVSRRRKGPG
jgi:hypothetical protein